MMKTTVVPSTEFLGFILNTKTMTVALPTAKMKGIQSDVAKILHNQKIGFKILSQLLGKLVTTKPAVLVAPLHYRALQHLKISMMRLAQNEVAILPEAWKDLMWWDRQLPMHHCSPIVQREATVIIESDASLKGWDAPTEVE